MLQFQCKGWRAETGGEAGRSSAREFCFVLEGWSLLIKPSAGWGKTHNMEGNLLYSKFTNLNIDPYENTLQLDT